MQSEPQVAAAPNTPVGPRVYFNAEQRAEDVERRITHAYNPKQSFEGLAVEFRKMFDAAQLKKAQRAFRVHKTARQTARRLGQLQVRRSTLTKNRV